MALFKDRDSRRESSSRRASSFSGRSSHLFCRTPLAKSLRFETLEDRRLLAVLTVDTDQDIVDFNDGRTSLREAIFAANTVPGADEIVFDLGEGPKTILFTQGELKITDSLTITGSGAELLTIDASGIQDVSVSSVFNIKDGKVATAIDASIRGLSLTGAQNSAIRNRENLTLTSVILSGNKSTSGGAVWMDQPFEPSLIRLDIIDSTIINNSAGYSGGAIYFGGDNDQISIQDTVISDNKVDSTDFGQGGGICIQGLRNHVEIIDTRIENNSAPNGGGIYVTGSIGGDVRIIGSSISHNTALSGGGGIYARVGCLQIERSAITENVSGNDSRSASGGGLRFAGIDGGEVVIKESTISGNSASSGGGGVDVDGILSVNQSTFAENSSQYGGAIRAHDLILHSSTVSGNSAQSNGGGIFSRGYATIVSSTISANSAGYEGGGISARHTLLEDSLVAKNTAHTMPDVIVRLATTVGSVFKSRHSLISYSTSPILAEAPVGAPDAYGNIIGGTIHGAIDPILGPLADNGGPTKTHALLPGSPAINAGDPNAVAGANGIPEFDQRGEPFTRVSGGRMDIGAFEAQSLIVDTLIDENDGDYSQGDFSLREAIALANQIAGENTIEFDTLLSSGTVLLTMGEMVITDSVEIVGLGAELLTVDAQLQSRIFNITEVAGDVSFKGITLRGGLTTGNNQWSSDTTFSGGAIRSVSTGKLLIEDCVVTASGTTGNYAIGGGIFVSGPFTMSRTIVSDNRTLGNYSPGGGIALPFNLQAIVPKISESQITGNFTLGNSSYGGGVFAYAAAVEDSVISNNRTYGSNSRGGGVYARSSRPDWTITRAIFEENKTYGSGSSGGAIYSRSGLTIIDNQFRANATNALYTSGGAVAITGNWASTITTSSFMDNLANGGSGGAVASFGRGLTLTDSILTGNQAFRGGAISGNSLTVTRSKISDNAAMGQFASGGGIFAVADLTITQSEISGNRVIASEGRGGGVYTENAFSRAVISNSTISGNSVVGTNGKGGGISFMNNATIIGSTVSGNQLIGSGQGAGIYSARELVVEHSTITDNQISSAIGRGAGISVRPDLSTISHTIVAANYAGLVDSDLHSRTSSQPNLRYSLIGSNAGTNLPPAPVGSPDANGNLIGTTNSRINPLLAPLADNGGPTKTHALLDDSPATDAGDPTLLLGQNGTAEFDQRGAPFTRIYLGRVDIGAYEFQPDQGTFVADFDYGGDVDGRDFMIWQRGFGMSGPNVTRQHGDATGDGDVDANDLAVWQATYGKYPLPGPTALSVADDEIKWQADAWVSSLAIPVQSVDRLNPGIDLVDAAFEDSEAEAITPSAVLSNHVEEFNLPGRIARHAATDHEELFAELGDWRAVGNKILDFCRRMPR